MTPTGSLIGVASSQGILIWDASTTTFLKTLEGVSGVGFADLAWSPDSTRIAGAGLDTTVSIWDVASEQLLATLSAGLSDYVAGIAWSADGSIIVSAAVEGALIIWDASTYERLGVSYQVRENSMHLSMLGPPMEVSRRANDVGLVLKPNTAVRQDGLQIIQGIKVSIDNGLINQRPQMFSRL